MVEEALHHTNCIANIAFISDSGRNDYGAIVYSTRKYWCTWKTNLGLRNLLISCREARTRISFLEHACRIAIPAELQMQYRSMIIRAYARILRMRPAMQHSA